MSRKRKLAYGAVSTLIALALFECVARMLAPPPGPRRTLPAFRDFVGEGAEPTFVCAKRGGRLVYEHNPRLRIRRCARAAPFAASKQRGVVRVFCLGASTVFGDKLPSAEAFPSILAKRLAARGRFEVINLGQNGAASPDLVRLVQEVVRYGPDLLLVYAGHNEFQRYYQEMIEFGPQGWSGQGARWVLRNIALARLLGTLVGGDRAAGPRLFRRWLYSASSVGSHLAAMAEDHRRIEERFRRNIVRIIDAARGAGAKVAFCTVVSNLEGVEPLKSVHLVPLGRREEMEFDLCYVVGKLDLQFARGVGGARWRDEVLSALAYLNRAMAIDATYADMRYRRGKCLALLGRYGEAKREFEAARDLDMATGRARSYINRALKEECGKRGVPVVGIVPAFEAAAHNGIMGGDLFIDEVHPNARGQEIIARSIADAMFSRAYFFSTK